MTEETVALLAAVVLVPLLWALMWLGWRRRGRRQADLPEPPAVPADLPAGVHAGVPAGAVDDVEAVYVSSTHAGRPLDRIVAHGLGARSNARVRVSRRGVLVARQGAADLWVPREAVLGVRRERGMAGKVVEREGLVVLTWRLGDVPVDTGLRLRREADRERLVDAVTTMLEVAR